MLSAMARLNSKSIISWLSRGEGAKAGYERTFTIDFERYISMDEVEVYIAVK